MDRPNIVFITTDTQGRVAGMGVAWGGKYEFRGVFTTGWKDVWGAEVFN